MPPPSKAGSLRGLQRLIKVRKDHAVFTGGETQVIESGSPQVFAFVHTYHGERVLVFANFGEEEQVIPANLLRLYGLSYGFTDLLTGEAVPSKDLNLTAYQLLCLK